LEITRNVVRVLEEVLMLKKLKFFVFSDKTLGYREIKSFKRKVAFSSIAMGFGVFGGLFFVNYIIGDPLGITRNSGLVTENKVLREELRGLTEKLDRVQASLENLAQHNNDLRLAVALPKLDDDTRKAPSGGSLDLPEFSFLGSDANALLSNSNEVLSRLEREVQLQKQSYEEIALKYESNKMFFRRLPAIKPCEGPYSLNGFGMRIHPVLGVWRMHEGLDILNEDGTPIYASGDATVHFAGVTHSGYGRVIELDHGHGYTTLYAHLSAVLVREGKKVKRGELIGRVGHSGLVSGPHLHYEVRLNGRRMNPVDFFFDDVHAARYRLQLASTQ
jgi:murein DD-endopeptidase MepM/ murein hydrolase activator NlpD